MALDEVRADIVPEIMALFHPVMDVEVEIRLLAGAVEIMEDAQPFRSVQLLAFGAEGQEVGGNAGAHPVEIGPGLLDVLPGHGDGEILLLDDAVAGGGLAHHDAVVFPPVSVQAVALHGHEDRPGKAHPVQRPVVHGDLGGGAGVQAV